MKIAIPLLSILLLLSSCNSKPQTTNNTKNETPQALQDEKPIYTSVKSRYNNLLEQLYAELVAESAELQELEKQIETIADTNSAIDDDLAVFEKKSNDYYANAWALKAEITDSAMYKQIAQILTASKEKYTKKLSGHQLQKAEIKALRATLNDQHSMLKIVLTLPLIEAFQESYKPNLARYQQLREEIKKTIQQIETLQKK